MIRMEHVSKKFGEKTVLRDVSLELADGGRVAVEGPSGCGKTTLLNIMMGLLPQDAGNILRSNVDKMAA
ncbi:MAG: ATP-binding cassette domain-containing protein, partial [Eubacteriales bacterium]|nr:ATP-binding cassette domain-containing protein [Eubacteriales bacterium]